MLYNCSQQSTRLSTHSLIQDSIDQVKEIIEQNFQNCSEKFDSLFRTVSPFAGKMIRPELLLLAGLCTGKINHKHILAAASVELIHTASLLHDDVIDQGELRRGQTTLNMVEGNRYAILAGDLLLCKAFKLTSQICDTQASNEICSAATMMCEGELNQNCNENNFDTTQSQYYNIITCKTASLFASCARLGAMCSRTSDTDQQSLEAFGRNFGIAYQIIDDYCDILSDRDSKMPFNDIHNKRLTLPAILYLEEADTQQRELFTKYFNTGQAESIRKILIDSGCDKLTLDHAEKYCNVAIEALDAIPRSETKTRLIEMTNSLIQNCYTR